MAAELVHSATNDKLTEMDWTKNIEICEIVACDHRQAKDVVKAIKKHLESKKTNTQLYAVMLLEMLINNIGEPVHKQVVDAEILPILVKIVKKKSDLSVREKIFLLLDAAQSSVCGASEKFPQYYSSYSEVTSAGIQFPQRPHSRPKPYSTSNGNPNNASAKELMTLQRERSLQPPQARPHAPSESSILQKAGTVLEVLRDVLNTIDTQCPEGANDEFTLDLVEQCSFQKQRVMHLAVTSLDEKVVSRAIELNEQLERVLRKHDTLLSHRSMSTSNHFNHGHEEEEAEQLFGRIRKGKACVRPQDEEDNEMNKSMGLMSHALPGNIINRPLIRPLISERRPESLYSPSFEPKEETRRSLSIVSKEANIVKPSGMIPPPPSKPIEREKFFQNRSDGPGLHGHMRNLSWHSINTSSSHSGSTDFSD